MAQLATWEAKTDQRIKAINMNRRLKALQDRREADLDRRRGDLSCKLAAEQQVSSPGSASQPWQAEEVPVVDAVQDVMLNWAIEACFWSSLAGPVRPSMQHPELCWGLLPQLQLPAAGGQDLQPPCSASGGAAVRLVRRIALRLLAEDATGNCEEAQQPTPPSPCRHCKRSCSAAAGPLSSAAPSWQSAPARWQPAGRGRGSASPSSCWTSSSRRAATSCVGSRARS